MGQAKRRGCFEDRKAESLVKAKEVFLLHEKWLLEAFPSLSLEERLAADKKRRELAVKAGLGGTQNQD